MEKHNLDAEFLNFRDSLFPFAGQGQRLLGVRAVGGKPVLSLITLGSAGQRRELDSTSSVEDRKVFGIRSPHATRMPHTDHGHGEEKGDCGVSSSPSSVLGEWKQLYS